MRPIDIIITEAELYSFDWQLGSIVQEIHTGKCCPDSPFCDFYPPSWEMAFQCGWTLVGQSYNDDDCMPRLPVRVLWRPEWATEAVTA